MAPYAKYFAAAAQLVFVPLLTLVVAGIAFAIFNGALGGDATFRQVFAIVAFSGVVLALRALFATPLNYARESLSSPTTLPRFVPFFDDNTFAARLLGSIDLFLIWWMVSLAIGLGVLYKRRTAPIATAIARRVRRDRADDRRRQNGAVRSLDDRARTYSSRWRSSSSARPSSAPTSISSGTRASRSRPTSSRRATSRPSSRRPARFSRSGSSTSAPTRRAASSTSRSTKATASRRASSCCRSIRKSLRTRVDSGTASLQAAQTSLDQMRQAVETARVQLEQAQQNLTRQQDLWASS